MNNCPRFLAVGFPLALAFGLTVVLPALLAIAASAQTPGDGPRGRGPGGPGHPGGPGWHGRGPLHPIVRILDADRDREISASELASAPANIKALDVNGDGTVSADELRPARPAGAPTPPADRRAPPADSDRPRPLDPLMLALDADKNGDLSTAEIANATTSLKALDLDGDGKLTPEEYRPLPPEGVPAREGMRHRGGSFSAPAR